MMPFKQLLVVLSMLTMLASCTTKPLVFTGFDATQDFTSFKTFTWIKDPPLMVNNDYTVSPLVETRLTAAIKAELIMHGYTFVKDKEDADFIVMYTIGVSESNQVNSPKDPEEKPGSWAWGRGNAPYFFEFEIDKRNENLSKGIMAIDIFNAKSMIPVWHAQAAQVMTKKELISQAKNAPKVVEELLYDFPFVGCHVEVTEQCQPFLKAL